MNNQNGCATVVVIFALMICAAGALFIFGAAIGAGFGAVS